VATVVVVDAERTLGIEAASITSGEVNEAGHLILTRQDGTPIDVGAVSGMQLDTGITYAKVDAFTYVGDTDPGAVPDGSVWLDTNEVAGPFSSDTQKGLVELATLAETNAFTDATRAVTPAGLAGVDSRLDALELTKLQTLAVNANTETAPPTAYPVGISLMTVGTGSGWSHNSGFGSVVTTKSESSRTQQTFYANASTTSSISRMWVRYGIADSTGWTAWSQAQLMYTLTPGTLVQTSAFTSYPSGWSRMYFSTANGTGWDFAGTAGELVTYVDGTTFAKQTYVSHGHNSTTAPAVWTRTANAANGWSAWAKQIPDTGSWFTYTPAWTTSTGLNTPSYGNAVQASKWIKHGRFVTVMFDIAFGSTTNFGGGGGSDNWRLGLPVPASSSSGTLGFLELWDESASDAVFARARLGSTTTFELCMSVGFSGAKGIIVDSSGTQPWAWATNDCIRGVLTYESAA
jgi:hypothetical protein